MYFLAFDFGILLSLNLIFYIVLGLAVLFGFLSGFKKSLFKLITMAIYYIVFFTTLNLMANVLWSADLSFAVPYLTDFLPELSGFTSFEASYESLLPLVAGDSIDTATLSPEFIELFASLMIFVLKIIWTVLYFTVLLVIYKFICFIIRIIFFKNKKDKEHKKSRLFGALVGAGNGALALFIMIVMMGGVMSSMDSLLKLMTSSTTLMEETSGEETLNFTPREELYDLNYSLLSEPTTETTEPTEPVDPSEDEQLEEMIATIELMVEEYNSNIFVSFANLIQAKSIIDEDVKVPLHINLFDSVLSFDYNEETIAIRYELMVFADAAEIIANSEYLETQDLNDLTGDEVRGLFNTIANSKLIVSATPVVIEYLLIESEQDIEQLVSGITDGTIDVQEELLSLGEIFATVVDSGINFDNLMNEEDPNLMFPELAKIDLTIFLESDLLTEFLIQMLDSDNEFTEFLTIPSNINWKDTETADGELRKIFEALNELLDVAATVNFDDFDFGIIADMDSDTIDAFFDSYVIRATITEMLKGMDFDDDMPVILPDSIYDDLGYIEKAELVNVAEAIKLIIDPDSESGFDPMKALSLTDSEVDQLFASDVLFATIGNYFNTIDTSEFIIPDSVNTLVLVDGIGVDVVTRLELKNLLKALNVFEIDGFSGVDFDASYIDKLENVAQDDIDSTKVDTILASEIIYATFSQTIIDLDKSQGGALVIPEYDVDNNQIITVTGGLSYIDKTEIYNVIRAIYTLNIADFNDINVDDTNTLKDNLPVLLESAIFHATISDEIITIGSSVVVPEKDIDDQEILVEVSGVTYIIQNEIEYLVAGLDLLGVSTPNSFDQFNFGNLDTDAKRNQLLDSAILHATISDQLLGVDQNLLKVPNQDETGVDLIIPRGTVIVNYVIKNEVKAIIAAMIAMGYNDVDDLSMEIDEQAFIDNMDLVLESASMQATVSDQILNSTSLSALIVPDDEFDDFGVLVDDIRIIYPDVTFIRSDELRDFFNSIDLLNIVDLDFDNLNESSMNLTTILTFTNEQRGIFLDSYIILATISDYFLDASGDETDPYGTTQLLIPTTERIDNTVETLAIEVVRRAELLNILVGFDILGLTDYNDSIDPDTINSLTATDIDKILISNSFHITIDNMIRGNANVSSGIPALAEDATTYPVTVITKTEITEFIIAAQQFSGVNFSNVTFSVATVTALTPEERDEVLDSMIVRNMLTNEIELIPGYVADPNNYMNNDTNTFLTEAGINAVLGL